MTIIESMTSLRGNVAEHSTPPVVVEPADPYPYLYGYLADSNSLHMAIGSVAGEAPEPPPAPTIASVAPTTIVVDVSTPVTVTGTGFVDGDVVYQDEAGMTTTFVSETELTLTALASSAGIVDVTVVGGGGTSNAVQITVNAPVADEESAE
jgi:hypothetical protein